MKRAAVAGALASILVGAAPLPVATLAVQIGNVRNDKGILHVDVCPEAYFLKDGCPYTATAAARTGTTIAVVRNVPAGRYAVQAFHDENHNGKVDRALLGIPREGVGFSNDAPIRFGPPKWAAAVIVLSGSDQTIALHMRYFLGASGPAGK
jgi:uncharacterized protein (DUF2141 family)